MTNKSYKIITVGEGLERRQVIHLFGLWSQAISDLIHRENIKHMMLRTESSIECLHRMPEIEDLEITVTRKFDPAPLYDMPRLRSLNIAHGQLKSALDMSKLKNVRELGIAWRNLNSHTLGECNALNSLGIGNLTEDSLEVVTGLSQLRWLSINGGGIVRIGNVQALSKVIRLHLVRVNKLDTLESISGLSSLRVLWIQQARRLKYLRGLGSLKRLRTINLNGCPVIDSLKPLRGATKLETIGLMNVTCIKDGDLSVIEELPSIRHVTFVDRAHYTHRDEHFPKTMPVYY